MEQFSFKKVCAMVKSDAYGHGIENIVKLLSDKVEYFGVANEFEGERVRKLTDKPILVVGKVCDYDLCKKCNLEIMVDDEMSIKCAIENGLKDNLHLKINCGMNRFGVSSKISAKIIDRLLTENDIKLKSIFTHFSKISCLFLIVSSKNILSCLYSFKPLI